MKRYSIMLAKDLDADGPDDAFKLFRDMIGDPTNTEYHVSVHEKEDRPLETFLRKKGTTELESLTSLADPKPKLKKLGEN